MLRAELEEIEVLIKKVGFYRVMAGRIQEISRILLEKYNGKVPADMEALLSFPGVGRKPANCVLAHAFSKDALAVDTHVHRISNRLGLMETGTPEATENELKKIFPKRYWKHVNYRSAEDRLASCFIPRSNLHESTGSSRRPGGASPEFRFGSTGSVSLVSLAQAD